MDEYEPNSNQLHSKSANFNDFVKLISEARTNTHAANLEEEEEEEEED